MIKEMLFFKKNLIINPAVADVFIIPLSPMSNQHQFSFS